MSAPPGPLGKAPILASQSIQNRSVENVSPALLIRQYTSSKVFLSSVLFIEARPRLLLLGRSLLLRSRRSFLCRRLLNRIFLLLRCRLLCRRLFFRFLFLFRSRLFSYGLFLGILLLLRSCLFGSRFLGCFSCLCRLFRFLF